MPNFQKHKIGGEKMLIMYSTFHPYIYIKIVAKKSYLNGEFSYGCFHMQVQQIIITSNDNDSLELKP